MPIINPWIFYLTELLTYIDSVLNILVFIIMVTLIILIITYFFDIYYQDEDESKLAKKWLKKAIIGLIIIRRNYPK